MLCVAQRACYAIRYVYVLLWLALLLCGAQGVAIAILVSMGVIRKEDWTTVDKLNVASGIQARA